MSNVGVTNPSEWHLYPAGAHHKLTECSPTLHFMITEHRPDLQIEPPPTQLEALVPEDVSAKKPSFPQHNTLDTKPLSPDRVELSPDGVKFLNGGEELRYTERQMMQIVAEARRDALREDGHEAPIYGRASARRKVAEQAPSINEVQAPIPPASSAPQAPHRCARFMIVGFFDGTDFQVDFQKHPMAREHGWKFRSVNGVEMLIIGHGVPRKMFPVRNIKFMDLIPEDY